jgi:hypothetical protein
MDLRPPPADAHKQKPPVVKEFRRLALKSVPDKLERPSNQKESNPINPKSVEEDAADKNRQRKQNGRNTQRVAHPVHRMLVTGAVLRDPLLVSASAQHAGMISRSGPSELSALRQRPRDALTADRDYNKAMYHYNPSTALEELNEEATLPNPVHVRDMMLRRKLSADQALELNRIFLEYQKFFGETQKLGKDILKRLAA